MRKRTQKQKLPFYNRPRTRRKSATRDQISAAVNRFICDGGRITVLDPQIEDRNILPLEWQSTALPSSPANKPWKLDAENIPDTKTWC